MVLKNLRSFNGASRRPGRLILLLSCREENNRQKN
jgi:hypothetical protein